MAAGADPTRDTPELYSESPPDTLSMRTFGFWLYMLGDSLIFTALFVSYGVLQNNYAGGPTASAVYTPFHFLFESVLIYFSVFSVAMGMRGLARGKRSALMLWFCLALAAGGIFLGIEIYDFNSQVALGITPLRSAFLSIYFTVVGTHGLHVAVGLLWIVVMLFQVGLKGFSAAVIQRLLCLEIFWLYQGFIWACVFTFVELWSAI
ncbi:hypothetical protein [Salinisphaera sp.]|uniref:hypothetical protein n=1 Tax=Salinisphaera sp. TaxID=1914330 RepID=UPI002D790027|nr:hypothetical protein [Salinisphaera sp.]HET7313034.1 hypothetical protein [Salinisphaera sp.]